MRVLRVIYAYDISTKFSYTGQLGAVYARFKSDLGI